MKIVLKRCTLRPWTMDDVKSLARHANNPKIASNLRDVFPHPYLENDAIQYIELCARKDGSLKWAIEVNNEAAGSVALLPMTDIYRKNFELGYWLGEEHWGKGIITEVVAAVCQYAFEQTNIHRLYARVFSENTASAKILLHNGFVQCGHMHQSVFKMGVFHDELIFEKIKKG